MAADCRARSDHRGSVTGAAVASAAVADSDRGIEWEPPSLQAAGGWHPDPLGRYEVGGKAALDIWIDFMRVALQNIPEQPVEIPEGITQARVDPDTGLLARLENHDAIMEVFITGSLPPMEDTVEGDHSDAGTEEDPYDTF